MASVVLVAISGGSTRRRRGSIDFLPSGSARVRVYGGKDQLTGKDLQLAETVPASDIGIGHIHDD